MGESRKSNRPKKLKATEVQELLHQAKSQTDAELTALGAGEARVFSDGRVLFMFEDGKGILYESREQLSRILLDAEAAVKATSPQALLPTGSDFPQQVPALLESLPAILETNPAALDKSEESLDILENVIRRRGAMEFLDPQKLPPMVAYVGEVIRNATSGDWQMHYDKNQQTWEPLIVDPSGRTYQPLALVLVELQLGSQGSIRGAVNGVLRADFLSTDDRKPS